MIRSYELGVLFLPSSFKRRGSAFSCTCNVLLSEGKGPSQESSEVKKTKLVTLAGQKKESLHSPSDVIIPLPLPYELPPLPYSSQDVPWSWDRQYKNKDVYGQVWPRMWAYQHWCHSHCTYHLNSSPWCCGWLNGTYPCAYSLSNFRQRCFIFIPYVLFSCQKYIKYWMLISIQEIYLFLFQLLFIQGCIETPFSRLCIKA